jgi:hypothetical protein
MNNLLELFYFAGDRVDYVIVHNPAKVRTNLFKKSNIEAELKKFGAKELTLPVVTSITLLAIKRAEAKAGRKLSFAEVATPGASHLELMLAGEMQWAMQQDVPAIRRNCRFAGARTTSAGRSITTGTGGKTVPPKTSDAQPWRMSMDSDKDDLAALCAGVTTDEVDRVHRLLHEWSVGPDSSFPVQLALLTKAQWRIAANLPRLMNDGRKLIELHLAEYRRQSQAMADDFADTMNGQNKELKKTVEVHIQATRQAAEQIQVQLADAEAVAKRVKALMESAASEWRNTKTSTTAQCERLEQVSNDLQDRFAWRVILRTAVWLLLALGIGLCIGHYWIR